MPYSFKKRIANIFTNRKATYNKIHPVLILLFSFAVAAACISLLKLLFWIQLLFCALKSLCVSAEVKSLKKKMEESEKASRIFKTRCEQEKEEKKTPIT